MTTSTPLPALTLEQQQEGARLARDTYHILPEQQAENGGRAVALLAKQLLQGDLLDRPIVVLAGCGENGALGLIAARHLLNWGAWVQLVLVQPPEDECAALAQPLASLQAIGAPLAWAEEGWELPPADLIIDALHDATNTAEPHGKLREWIQLANSSIAPIVSVDLPCGVDVTTGKLHTPHIQATATVAFALPKTVFYHEAVRLACGELYLADLGIPPQLFSTFGWEVPPIFARDSLVKLVVNEANEISLA